MEIKLELPRARFLPQESMALRVTLRNAGSVPLDLPDPGDNRNAQPQYVLSGPSFPKGHAFSFRSSLKAEHGAALPPAAPALKTLAPGQSMEATLPLESLVEIDKPGRYTLAASLSSGGTRAEATPLAFDIDPAELRSLALNIDDGFQKSLPIRVSCLARLPGGAGRLYQAILHEDRPDLGEVDLMTLVPLADLPAAAGEVLGVWTRHDRMDSLLNRFVWRAEGQLGVEGLAGTPGQQLAGAALPPRLLAPALMADNGELDLFGLDAEGRQLQLLRFPARGDARSWPARAVGGQVLAGRAAIGPRAGGNRRVAALLVDEGGEQLSLQLVEAAADGPGRQRGVKLGKAFAMPDTGLAVSVEADGSVRVAVPLADDAARRKLALADAVFPPGDAPATVQRSAGPQLPLAARSAVAAHAVTAGTRRRDWLVLLQDGRVLFSGSNKNRPRPLNGVPVLPLQLLPMSRHSYLLSLGERHLPQLELMF